MSDLPAPADRHDDYTPPKPKALDHTETAVAIVANLAASVAFPLLGAASVESLKAVLGSRLDRRRDTWMQSIAEGLSQLEARVGGVLDGLETNERFITAFIRALPAAQRTHHEEKRRALRNAVLNTASDPDGGDRAETFIRCVDELTPSHLVLLGTLDHHNQELAKVESLEGILSIVGAALPTPLTDHDTFRSTCQDLQNAYLVRIAPGVDTYSDLGMDNVVSAGPSNYGKPNLRVTDLGRDFLRFIAEPQSMSNEPNC